MRSNTFLTLVLVIGAAVVACGGNVSLGGPGGSSGSSSGDAGDAGGPFTDSGAIDCSAPNACGPRPGAPAQTCADGSIGGNTGRCIAMESTCGWEMRACPPDVGSCFDAAGELLPTLKKCTTATDCVAIEYALNCCGTRRMAGTASSQKARVEACAADRAKTLPACGCPTFATGADDKSTQGATPATVTCNSKGLCESSFDGACAGVPLPACPADCTTFPMTGTCTAGAKCRQAGSQIGDECTCGAGTWGCSIHPPLGPGCNLVCR